MAKDKLYTSPTEDLETKVRQLDAEVGRLKGLLGPLAILPDDPTKSDDDVLYSFVRDTGKSQILCGDIRKARQALK